MPNILQAVQTYQRANLALLLDQTCFITTANTKFKNFNSLVAQLGDTVTFDKPPRFRTKNSLVAVPFGDVEQRTHSLTCATPFNVSYAYSAQEFIFYFENPGQATESYLKVFGRSAAKTLAEKCEIDMSSDIINHTYRFYPVPNNSISSIQQVSQAAARYRAYGAASGDLNVYIPLEAEPAIVGTMLNQFVTDRNERVAKRWQIGSYADMNFYRSNLLPLHIAGFAGDNNEQLTFDSISADGTQITFTTPTAAQADYLKAGDLLYFEDVGVTPLRYLTWTGYHPSSVPVQVRVIEDADAVANQVVAEVFPALIYDATDTDRNANLNRAITPSDTARVIPSHRAGLMIGGEAWYLAMPKLPDQNPYETAVSMDEETGVSMRQTFGTVLGQNEQGMIHDVIMGHTMVDEYAMRLIFPVTV